MRFLFFFWLCPNFFLRFIPTTRKSFQNLLNQGPPKILIDHTWFRKLQLRILWYRNRILITWKSNKRRRENNGCHLYVCSSRYEAASHRSFQPEFVENPKFLRLSWKTIHVLRSIVCIDCNNNACYCPRTADIYIFIYIHTQTFLIQ